MMIVETGDFYWSNWLRKNFLWMLIIGILANLSGLFVTILEPDGALYATIAKTMIQSSDFVNLKVEGKDWLDKPHFPFWLTAISFRIFGINTFAYKLPALLFWTMGMGYTWLLAKNLYSKNVALLSVLIYLTAAHLVISNNDVRAEPYLTGLIIASVFHFYKSQTKSLSFHLVTGSLFAAFAAMTKGPFVLIIIASGFIVDWIIRKEWKAFFHYRWAVAIALISLCILPEIYCLYQQFDSHPEKIVFNRTGVSGIRFFFWDSQFGRFFNNGPIKGSGDPLFYFHTILWAFLPWSVLFVCAIITGIRKLSRRTLPIEGITIGTSLISFVLFSLSRFQLPHYMNIVFPFFSIVTAQFIYSIRNNSSLRQWLTIQRIISLLFILLIVTVIILTDMPNKYLMMIIVVLLCGASLYLLRKKVTSGIVVNSFLISTILYTFLNTAFYPNLLTYQSGSNAARYINQSEPGKFVCTYLENSYSFAFYINQPIVYYQSAEVLKNRAETKEAIIFTSEDDLADLKKSTLSVEILKVFPHFHISQLTLGFLNAKTRKSTIKRMVVARIAGVKQPNK